MKNDNFLYNNLALEKENIFPFYLIVGNTEKSRETVRVFLKEEIGFNFSNNIDFFNFSFDILKINDVKKISRLQLNKNSFKNNSLSKQIFFITAKDINIYAQNALLKMLEEPSENTFFFLFIESKYKILPTLLSRARTFENNEDNTFSKEVLKFIESDFKEREEIIKNIDNNQDKIIMLGQIEEYCLENKNNILKYYLNKKQYYQFEKKLLFFKKIAYAEGINISNILNYLAIKLPRVLK